jgi:hypothetical protein
MAAHGTRRGAPLGTQPLAERRPRTGSGEQNAKHGKDANVVKKSQYQIHENVLSKWSQPELPLP